MFSIQNAIIREPAIATQEIVNADELDYRIKLLAIIKDSDDGVELSVEPAMLASKRELESLILSPQGEPLPERFMGWRNNIITTELSALKAAFL